MSFFWLTCLKNAGDCFIRYGLDPCHYYSAPNISWDAMLKTTKVKLDLLSDIDMLLFYEKALRGGLNGIGEKRYMKANNKYLHDFDEGKTNTCMTLMKENQV